METEIKVLSAGESLQDCVSREEKGSSLAELGFLVATGCFSTVMFSDTVALFPTTVETLKDHCIDHLDVYRFGGQLIV